MPGSSQKPKRARSLHSHSVRRKPRAAAVPPTAAQIAQRARVKACALAWKNLDPQTQALWKNKGVGVRVASRSGYTFRLLHGYALFLQEWMTQRITSPALPLRPA